MRQLKITENCLTERNENCLTERNENCLTERNEECRFPNLKKTFSNFESDHVDRDYLSIIHSKLGHNLIEDLSIVQYKKVIHDTISKSKAFFNRRQVNPDTFKFFGWTVESYLMENYFGHGIFLDDIRNPKDVCKYLSEMDQIQYITRNWVVVRSFEDFKKYLENNEPPFHISLDHDLGTDSNNDPNPSGYEACKFLVDYIMDNKLSWTPRLYSHSLNPVGKMNILGYYSNFIKFYKQQEHE